MFRGDILQLIEWLSLLLQLQLLLQRPTAMGRWLKPTFLMVENFMLLVNANNHSKNYRSINLEKRKAKKN